MSVTKITAIPWRRADCFGNVC